MLFRSEEFADGYPVTIVTTALFPPVLFVEDEEMGADLNNGESQEIVLNIGNDTDDGDDLIWWTEFVSNPENPIVEEERDRQVRSARRIDGVAGPRRDEAGDLLGSFNGNNGANQYSSCVGWDPENEWMWVSNYITATCVAWIPDGNYENFEQGPALQGPGSCMDGTFANGMVYLGAWANASVGLWDAEGARIRNIQFPHAVYGLGADQENGWLFAMNSNNQNIHVYLFDEDGGFGDQIGIIDGAQHRQFHNNYASYGLEWVGEHADIGQLWMNDGPNNRVHQILVDTDEWDAVEEIQSFPAGNIANQYGAAAHDGVNLWESGYGAANVRIYDDGVSEMSWFTFMPEEGSVGGGAESDITVIFNAKGIGDAVLTGDLIIFSNDPQDGEDGIVVAVELVVNAAPDIEVVIDEDYINDDGDYDWNLRYLNLFASEEVYDMSVMVSNGGPDGMELTVDGIEFENDEFTVEPAEFVLAAGESQEVVVSFTSAEPVDVFDDMLIISDDPDEEEYFIPVHAHAYAPPVISIRDRKSVV